MRPPALPRRPPAPLFAAALALLTAPACLEPSPGLVARPAPDAALDSPDAVPNAAPDGLSLDAASPDALTLDAASPPPTALCPSLGLAPSTPLFLAGGDLAVRLVRADASSSDLTAWPSPAPPGLPPAPNLVRALPAGDLVFTYALWGGPSDPGGVVLSALTLDGAVLWRHVWPGAGAWLFSATPEGAALAITTRQDPVYQSRTVLLTPDGAATSLPEDLSPLGRPTPGGPLAAQRDRLTGWFDPATARFTPVSDLPTVAALRVGPHLVSLHAAPTPQLLVSTPGAFTAFPFDGATPNGLDLVATDPAGWALVTDLQAGLLHRFDLARAAHTAHPYAAPGAWRPFSECYRAAATVDARGRLLAAFRDDTAAQVLRLDPSAPAPRWEPVGPRFTGVDDLSATLHGPNVVVRAFGHGMTYCPQTAWPSPDPDAVPVTLGSVWLVDAAGEATLLGADPWGTAVFSRDGRCAAVFDGDKPSHYPIVDLPTGATVDLELTDWPVWLR